MLEDLFAAINDRDQISIALRIVRYLQLMRMAGLHLYSGHFAGANLDEEGGHILIGLPNQLFLMATVEIGDETLFGIVLTGESSDGEITLGHDGIRWILEYDRSKRPHPEIERLATLFGLKPDGTTVTLESTRLRGYLRELSRLTLPLKTKPQPAHP